MKKIVTVGTRESKLALAQTHWVIRELQKHFPELEFDIKKIKTEGDRLTHVALDQIGGKGVFVKEIEAALLDGTIDIAVHSMKDMLAAIPSGLKIGAIPVREDARDVLLSIDGLRINRLPEGALVGTSSLRRGLQLKKLRPDLQIRPIRGNVDTRIRKMQEGEFHAILLAAAGLNRLGLEENIIQYLSVDQCIPAVGQGALGIQIRSGDFMEEVVKELDHYESRVTVEAERAFLRALQGNCKIPVAAHAEWIDGQIKISGMLAYGEENRTVYGSKTTDVKAHEAAGSALATGLIEKLGITFEEWTRTVVQKG